MKNTQFRPLTQSNSPASDQLPPTINDTSFRHKIIQGEVNDENAWALGGVAGHAGLFAPATDIATFAQFLLRTLKGDHNPILSPVTLARFTQRESTPTPTSRALGWDTPSSSPSSPSSSGQYFSPCSFGHLGYTGTSLWIDPKRDISVTLLTNRTWPDNKSQAIQQFRPKFHDAVIKTIS